MGRRAGVRNGDGIRIQIGLEGTYGGFGFRAGLAAEAGPCVGDGPPWRTPEEPEIIRCGVSRRGSESLLPRRSGVTATGDDRE